MSRPDPRPDTPFRLAVVGGGPSATYAMERLSATVGRLADGDRLDVHIFERSSEFGAGRVHSWSQPTTSFLNRITGQVGFAADETVEGAGPLRAPEDRPTLYEWCRRRFAESGDPDFDLRPEDWPKRYVHGMALREMFAAFVSDLRRHPGAEVHLHPVEITDVREAGPALEVLTADGSSWTVDQVLLLTGHSHNRPGTAEETAALTAFAARTDATYIPYAYPLDMMLPAEVSGPETVVGCAGLGLTAIDEILYLTEGRGGGFVPEADGLLGYRPSGAEPARIVAFSGTGLFTFARPHNLKEQDPARYEHRGVFLTEEAVDRLREGAGIPVRRGGEVRRQLDFERHVLPVIVLEMAYVHYATLFGAGAAGFLAQRATPRYREFLTAADAFGGEGVATSPSVLLGPLVEAVSEIADALAEVLDAAGSVAAAREQARGWPLRETLLRWIQVVYGDAAASRATELCDEPGALAKEAAEWASCARLETSPHGNVFSWERTIEPIPPGTYRSADEYRATVLDFMDRDHAWAAQGNLDNPHKAAADGVWRDLRSVLGHAVDHAGLTATSHKLFLDRYMRHHNKLANGAALEVMEKMRALIRHGLLDVSTGPGARVVMDEATGRFRVEGTATGASRFVDTLADARVHPFSPHRDTAPLYRNLVNGGLARIWRNESADGTWYEPGGLELTPRFHPVRSDGVPEERITVLGPPSEGVMFFQLGALRPYQNHHVMQDVLSWLDDFWKAYENA